jgi:hypothetical protein
VVVLLGGQMGRRERLMGIQWGEGPELHVDRRFEQDLV